MLTPAQHQWIDQLSENIISIHPYDSTVQEKFEKVKQKIQSILGSDVPVEHHGATSLGISGQDEIDVFVPTPEVKFEGMIESLKKVFGEPKKIYPLDRVRFIYEQDGKKIDMFLINSDSDSWKNQIKFETYLQTHPESLEEYRMLKEKGNGLTVREYYRRKIEFINEILSKVP